MGVIFAASCDAGSFQHSSHLVAPFLRWFFPHITPEGFHTAVLFARKCAHLTEYAILALLTWRALRRESWQKPQPWHWPDAARTALLVVLYAASDEFHQSFVPSREATVRDVLIDTAGALLALLVLWWLQAGRSRQLRMAPAEHREA